MRKLDFVLNLLLVLSLSGLVWKLHHDWRDYAVHNGPQALEMHPLGGVSVPPAGAAPNYIAIAAQNPFHPERNDTIQQPAAQAMPSGPPPLVYGSIIMGDTRFALLATEQSPKAERVSEGSTFGGYRLAKVLPESVIFESPAGRSEIMFYNALTRLHRQPGKTVASSSARPSAPVPAVSSTSSPLPVQTEVVNSGPVTSPPAPTTPETPTIAVPPGKEVMQTPFGPIFIDKKKP